MTLEKAKAEDAAGRRIKAVVERGADTVKGMVEAIRKHQALYDEGKAEISDEQFDALVARLRKLAPKHPVLDELGEPKTGERLHHAFPMLSLEKAKSADAVLSWARKLNTSFIVAPKYDGLALSLTYAQGRLVAAVTRGDGRTGDDVMRNVQHMTRCIPARLHDVYPPLVTVRGEALFPRDSTILDEGFANARNAAAGTIMRKTPDLAMVKELEFIAYDVLPHEPSPALNTLHHSLDFAKRWGFEVGEYRHIDNELLKSTLADTSAAWASEDFRYECDGLVVKVDRYTLRNELGATSHHPKWAIALKFATDKAKTTLRKIVWQVARSGTITPVAVVEPVKLSGAMVERATLHNLDQLRRLHKGLALLGAEVEMCRRGGVIPHVESVVKAGACLILPKKCPSCGEPAIDTGTTLVCSEPQSCPGVQLDVMHHWCSTLDMLGWGEEVLAKLWEWDIRSRARLYTADATIQAIGKTLGNKLLKERDRKAAMEPAVFLAALGIPGVGRTQAQKLLDQFHSVKEILQLIDEDSDDLAANLTPALYMNLTDGVRSQREEISELLEHVKLKQVVTVKGPLNGMSIVFTGRLSTMEREEARAWVRELGAETPDSVTMKTTHLVVGSLARDEQITKRAKAEKYNAKGAKINVIDEDAFSMMVANAQENYEP